MTAVTSRRRVAASVGLAVVISCGGDPAGSGGPVHTVDASDVHRFVAVWPSFNPADTSCAWLRPYWNEPGAGLRAYQGKFDATFLQECRAVRARPERYGQLASRLGEIDSAAAAAQAIYARFDSLHPLSNHPVAYLVVGNGIAAGNTTLGRHPSILIGMELNRTAAGLPWTIAHELVHTQQRYPLWGTMTGGPAFLRGSLLRHAIKEGAADFVAELVTGRPVRNAYGESHEAQVWSDFQRDMPGKDYRGWLYNGWNARSLGERPPDLGYWVGYRITKAWYDRQADKRAALSAILAIDDFEAFLAASKYAGR